MAAVLALKKTWKSFGGMVHKYTHDSTLYWLSGLTCNEDNFITKAGALKAASEHGLALVCPDTSPRGANIPGDSDSWDFGVGAGFYVNATNPKWSKHYNLYTYVTKELPELIQSNFPVSNKQSVFGHSMGGHGALICFLKNPGLFQSVSAFSPICRPTECPWGRKAFSGYLGDDISKWKEYDATELISSYKGPVSDILIDQGDADEFLIQKQLQPEALVAAARKTSLPIELRMQQGYDHSYFFISTFVNDHIRHHAKYLN